MSDLGTDVAGTDDIGARLRARGLRLTTQRERILAVVDELGHATPDEIAAEVKAEGINLSTVYRTLEVLEEVGLVRHAHLSDRAPTYHSVGGVEHFHVVCRGCHRVVSVGPEALAELLERLADEHGFTVDVGHLTVFGRCADCVDETRLAQPGAAGAGSGLGSEGHHG